MVSTNSVADAHQTYSSLAERQLRDMVLDGTLAAGARLNEVELSERFQISRGPLREAIQRLTSDGLLVMRSHRGAFVRSFSDAELRDLYALRAGLETWALRLAADRDLPALIHRLDEVQDATRQLVAKAKPAYSASQDFHRSIVEAAANSALDEAYTSTMQKIELARSRSAQMPSRGQESLDEHGSVVETLREGRVDAARSALEDHLLAAQRSALAALRVDKLIVEDQDA